MFNDGDDKSLSSFDILNWKIQDKEWEFYNHIGETKINSKVIIETNLIKNISIDVKGSITFPTIISNPFIKFDKLEVGGFDQKPVFIHNPSPNALEV